MKNKEFAKQLKTLMLSKNIGTSMLSELMEVSVPSIYKWCGGSVPNRKNQEKLAKIFGVGLSSLFFETEESDGTVIASNCAPPQNANMRKDIVKHIANLLDEAEQYPGALHHMYIELRKSFPKKMYHKIFVH